MDIYVNKHTGKKRQIVKTKRVNHDDKSAVMVHTLDNGTMRL